MGVDAQVPFRVKFTSCVIIALDLDLVYGVRSFGRAVEISFQK